MNRNHVRILLPLLWLGLALASRAPAQEWAKKMVKVTDHDFGTLAKGAKAEFAFELENIFEEDVHIAGVRSSCGCTIPTVAKDTLKTWEKTTILAAFNTRTFEGQRNATLTVTIDKPYYAELQLHVQGYIRRDVVFAPGSVDFGKVDQGSAADRKLTVTYAGRQDWKITDIRSANSMFEVELHEGTRGGGRVTYNMIVHLKPHAPEGYFQDQLILVTDDPRGATVPLAVEGRVVSALTVSPSPLILGQVAPGQTVTKQLVVIGRQPFKILEVKCAESGFEFKPSADAQKVHRIPVKFTAGTSAQKLSAKVEIVTDLASGATVTCLVTANVGGEAGTDDDSKTAEGTRGVVNK